MISTYLFSAVLLAGGLAATPAAQNTVEIRQQAAFTEFTRRLQAYTDLRSIAARTVPPLTVSADPAEIWHASDAVAFAIRAVRGDARQGDLFSPAIAVAFRIAVSAGCQGRDAGLLEISPDEMESSLPAAVVHGRWPMGAPLPMMPPDLLATLPPLPAGLEYRFMNQDLVLRDVDANLVIDFVPGAIPSTTSATRNSRGPSYFESRPLLKSPDRISFSVTRSEASVRPNPRPNSTSTWPAVVSTTPKS